MHIILWAFAGVLFSPPAAVLDLNRPWTKQSISRVIVPLPGSVSHPAPRYGGTGMVVPSHMAVLVFLKLQSRGGQRQGENVMKIGEIVRKGR